MPEYQLHDKFLLSAYGTDVEYLVVTLNIPDVKGKLIHTGLVQSPLNYGTIKVAPT